MGPTLTTDRFNTANSAYLFDGIDDYINIPTNVNLSPIEEVSLSVWIKTNDSSNNPFVFDRIETVDGYGLRITPSGNARLTINGGSADVISTSKVNDDEWHHIAATYSSIDGRLNIYVDAVLENTSSYNSPIDYNPEPRNGIGGPGPSNDPFFNGKIDDLRIYSKALTTEEVVDLCPVDCTLDIGNDTTICSSEFVLDAAREVEWSTGVRSESIIINTSGTYIARLDSSCGNFEDSISVTFVEAESLELEESYTFCEGHSIVLSVPNTFNSVLWSDGSDAYTNTFSSAGDYSVNALQAFCPSQTAVFSIEEINSIEREETIPLCNGEPVVINTISYDKVGTYTQSFTASNGCDSTLIIKVVSDPNCIDCPLKRETYTLAVQRKSLNEFDAQITCSGELKTFQKLNQTELEFLLESYALTFHLSSNTVFHALKNNKQRLSASQLLSAFDVEAQSKIKSLKGALINDVNLMPVPSSFLLSN